MDEATDFRRHAKECLDWAEITTDHDLRQKLLNLAKEWERAAKSVESRAQESGAEESSAEAA
jgi:hypothetical protein